MEHDCMRQGTHLHGCSALRAGTCSNGFPVNIGCSPAHIVSPNGEERWWQVAGVVPLCCDESYVKPDSADGDKA